MAEGLLAGELVGVGLDLLEGWLGGGVATGTLEPRQAGLGRVTRHFGGPEPTQLSRRNPLINSGLGTRHQRLVTSD